MEKNFRVLLQLCFGLALVFIFFYMMGPFIVPMLLGAVIAIVVFPTYNRLRKKLPRSLSSMICTLGVMIGFLLPMSLILYSAAYKLAGLVSQVKLPNAGAEGIHPLDFPILKTIFDKVQHWVPVDQEWLKDQSLAVMKTVLEKTSKVTAASLAEIPGFLLGFAIVIVSTYFFLVEGNKFLRFLSRLSSLKPEKLEALYTTFEQSCRGVVLGLLASALTQGVLFALFAWGTGVPNALFLGSVTLILAMIPLFGSTPLTIGAVLYLFFQGHPIATIVMLIGSIVIGVSDNVVRAVVMKESSEVHPLLALVSVFGAISLMGAPGIFLGPIIAAVFVAFLKMISKEWDSQTPEEAGLGGRA